MIKALILAAGRGTRLGEITKNRPKPTIEIAGVPIIERIIQRLHQHKITEIIVNLHHLPDIMPQVLTDNVLYYYEPRLLGHDGTIRALRNWLKDDDFFVINGDTLSNVDYTYMRENHRPESIMVLYDEWRAAGTWLYSRSFFLTHLPLQVYRPSGLFWRDVGTPERLKETKEYYETQT